MRICLILVAGLVVGCDAKTDNPDFDFQGFVLGDPIDALFANANYPYHEVVGSDGRFLLTALTKDGKRATYRNPDAAGENFDQINITVCTLPGSDKIACIKWLCPLTQEWEEIVSAQLNNKKFGKPDEIKRNIETQENSSDYVLETRAWVQQDGNSMMLFMHQRKQKSNLITVQACTSEYKSSSWPENSRVPKNKLLEDNL